MYQIHCLNKISPAGTDRLGENYTIGADLAQADAVLVRSAAMHDMELPSGCWPLPGPAPASTTSPWRSAANRASWCSTPPAPMPTP